MANRLMGIEARLQRVERMQARMLGALIFITAKFCIAVALAWYIASLTKPL